MFDDENGKRWAKSVKEIGGEILCVSQVTLYHTFKGNKLDFHHAMSPGPGQEFYNLFLEQLKTHYAPEYVKGEGELVLHT